MSNESNLRTCKNCLLQKRRIQDGKFANGRDKRWVDESGRQWCGSICPLCNKERARENMKRLRSL